MKPSTPKAAFAYSIPVMLGYVPIGIAFGLLAVDSGLPAWLPPLMSVTMCAGAAQFMAIAMFAAGAGLWEMAAATFVVNVRHVAYGLALARRFSGLGPRKAYMVFALTDETFALLASVPEGDGGASPIPPGIDRGDFMFFVALFDQAYWVAGSALGAMLGSMLPWKLEGLDFALTALFIVLAMEQWYRTKKALPFAAAAVASVAGTLVFGASNGLLAAMGMGLAAVAFAEAFGRKARSGGA